MVSSGFFAKMATVKSGESTVALARWGCNLTPPPPHPPTRGRYTGTYDTPSGAMGDTPTHMTHLTYFGRSPWLECYTSLSS